MATLTATGVTTSNGTLDGYYTGSTGTNTTFPIGSYLMFSDGYNSVNPATISATVPLYVPVNNNTYAAGSRIKDSTFNGGSALAGTWRIRGWGGEVSCQVVTVGLAQRTA